MAIVAAPVTLHMLGTEEEPKVHVYAVQNDTGRALLCSFVDWDVPTSATATMYVQTPADTTVSSTCTNNGDGTITAPFSSSMLVTVGEGKGMIEVTSGTKATSFAFKLTIRKKIGA